MQNRRIYSRIRDKNPRKYEMVIRTIYHKPLRDNKARQVKYTKYGFFYNIHPACLTFKLNKNISRKKIQVYYKTT